MRFFCFLLVSTTAFTSGCASLIAICGKDLWPINTREQFHEQFGEPTKKGEDNGLVYEEFTTRQKIAEPINGCYIWWYYAPIDLIGFPFALLDVAYKSIAGQTLRVYYDSDGDVRGVSLNGCPMRGPYGYRPKPTDSPTPPLSVDP